VCRFYVLLTTHIDTACHDDESAQLIHLGLAFHDHGLIFPQLEELFRVECEKLPALIVKLDNRQRLGLRLLLRAKRAIVVRAVVAMFCFGATGRIDDHERSLSEHPWLLSPADPAHQDNGAALGRSVAGIENADGALRFSRQQKPGPLRFEFGWVCCRALIAPGRH